VVDIRWGTWPDGGDTWRATVGTESGRNSLHIDIDDSFYERAGVAAAKVAGEVLDGSGIAPSELSSVIAAPAHLDFVHAFCEHGGIDVSRVITASNAGWHTVSFVGALERAHADGRLTGDGMTLFVCGAAGITAGACLYRT
jgi:3-oxoacyl-[acyl-carrier-protein] synthase III